MRLQWSKRTVENGVGMDIIITSETPAVLGTPMYNEAAKTWSVPILGDANTTVQIIVNDGIADIDLDADGAGEVVLDASTPGMRYYIAVVGAPEIIAGTPVPRCKAIVEVV